MCVYRRQHAYLLLRICSTCSHSRRHGAVGFASVMALGLAALAAGALDVRAPAGHLAGALPDWFRPKSTDILSSAYQHLYVVDGLIGAAEEARAVFDKRFANPRNAHPERFVWDFWHVTHRLEDFPRPRSQPSDSAADKSAADYSSLEDATAAAAGSESTGYGSAPLESHMRAHGSGQQYTMLRTAAADYFEQELFERLCIQITEFGREQLGCDAITPPWLALYVDGCSQNFHTDAPHGPFAFILSLTLDGAYAPQDGNVSNHY